MLEKGMYAGAIALIAVIILGGVAFSSVSFGNVGQQPDYSKPAADVKRDWQAAYLLLGKSVSDAIADSIHDSGCAIDEVDLETQLDIYAFSTMSESIRNCSRSVENVDTTETVPSNVSVSFKISCGKAAGGITASYEKAMDFEKNVWIDNSMPGTCYVDVEDAHSGVCEVDKIGDPMVCGS